MFRKHTPPIISETEAESPWISFTDLMAGFLVVILLALTAAIILLTLEKNELRKEREIAKEELAEAKLEKSKMVAISKQLLAAIDRVKESQAEIVTTIAAMSDYDVTRKQLLEEIKDNLLKQNIKVQISKAGDVMHISEDNLSYALGSYKIENKYHITVDIIGGEIARQLKESRLGAIIDTVFVEGHTDNVRNSKEMGNWGLSSYRAISLWAHWQNSFTGAQQLHKLTNTAGKPLFSVAGYGDTRPLVVFKIGTTEDQRVNRRIDIRFNLQAAKSDLLEKLSDQVSKSLIEIEKIHKTVQEKMSEDQE